MASAHAEILNHDFTGIISPTSNVADAGNLLSSELSVASMAGTALAESLNPDAINGARFAHYFGSSSSAGPRLAESMAMPQTARPLPPSEQPSPFNVLALGLLTVGATAWRQRSSTATDKFSA